MSMVFVGSDIVHMDANTFMWVQLTHFSFDASMEDRSVIEALIGNRGYVHDYASPFDVDAPVTEPAVHGRWYRDRIQAELFEPLSASDAERLIRAWADDQDWNEPGYRQPLEVIARLGPVFELLRAGDVYKLCNPGAEAEHEYGFVTGNGGFHEFVVMDRTAGRLHVIVASDD